MKEKPVHGTHEWASHNVNCVVGCSNNCHYCYAKTSAVASGRKTPQTWYLEEINQKAVNKGYRKRKGTIMFPSTHDISTNNIDACVTVLNKLLKAGNQVLIVSKPNPKCIERLCCDLKQYKDQILFRFTIGSASNAVLGYWEPMAPKYEERLYSLQFAFNSGFKTSISCEPMLDFNIGQVISDTRKFVTNAIWLGKANKLFERLRTNGVHREVFVEAKLLIDLHCDENMWSLYNEFKDDPIIKWKDSIKQIVGIERPTKKGLDV